MREKVSVVYYPDFHVGFKTLQKAMLLFDELHFLDRPAFTFQFGASSFGMVGAHSPLRQYEQAFRDQGVPFYVHQAPGGPVSGEVYDLIKADVNDSLFLMRFQNGLRSSATFRDLQVPNRDYGKDGNQEAMVQKLVNLDLPSHLRGYENAIALFEDSSIPPFDLATQRGVARFLISGAVTCSARLNYALDFGADEGFIPLADAAPYGDLLGAKYARAVGLASTARTIQLSDLTFAIFDDLIPTGTLDNLTLGDVLKYRNASKSAREAFLEYLVLLQTKPAAIVGPEGDYASAIAKLIETEIRPAVRAYKNKLDTIYESLFGSLAKGVVGAVSGVSAIKLFTDLSWPSLLSLAGLAAGYSAKAVIDTILADRAAKRECSISYVLSLDQ